MVKALIKWVFRKGGFRIIRIPKQHGKPSSARQPSKCDTRESFADMITKEPLNPILHLNYADEASRLGRSYLAYAELKTAEFLGADKKEIQQRIKRFQASLPRPEYLNHNRYFRLISTASEIINRGNHTELSVLDVGGGEGQLASFIPQTSYCLAEPTVNGISGIDLPFPDHSFD